MSFAEFRIRAYAYNRKQVNDLKLYRRQLYTTLVANYQDVKKLPKSEAQFMPLPGDQIRRRVSDEARQKFLEKRAEFERKKAEAIKRRQEKANSEHGRL